MARTTPSRRSRPERRHAAPARRARPSPLRCPRHNPWPRPRARARLLRARARPPRLLPHEPPEFKHLRFWPAGRPGPPPDSAARCWWLGRSVGQPADHFRRSSRAQGGKDTEWRVGSAAEQHSGERGPQGLLRRLALRPRVVHTRGTLAPNGAPARPSQRVPSGPRSSTLPGSGTGVRLRVFTRSAAWGEMRHRGVQPGWPAAAKARVGVRGSAHVWLRAVMRRRCGPTLDVKVCGRLVLASQVSPAACDSGRGSWSSQCVLVGCIDDNHSSRTPTPSPPSAG